MGRNQLSACVETWTVASSGRARFARQRKKPPAIRPGECEA